ncbi:fimbrial biogenesis chaperone [Sphingomonas nostoxanthinifaciens]|uniref:fimbrial biogenesis chaperone n=1 Tax=Sphingomonas nostoxanthinifaciens TaxID=2872652 RepID=UPI001CC1C681|nr:molecular chaperone [Sphingomonas nostoxanthinifaciens]UAK22993.1 molecular chaperone [Sphingomonas nostoxanthinifaciens]
MRTLLFGGAVLAASIGTPLPAASLRLSPIGIEIPAAQRASSLTVANIDPDPVSIQVRVFRWSQPGGKDQLEPATDIIVSPPVATIPGGASYTVRVARLAMRPITGEQSYRLVIDEIPKPFDPNKGPRGVAVVLRTSMPVFIQTGEGASHLVWSLWQDGAGLHAEVRNDGQRHARISALAVDAQGVRLDADQGGLNPYVLTGTTRRFDLKPAAGQTLPPLAGKTVALTAKNGDEPIKEAALVGAR